MSWDIDGWGLRQTWLEYIDINIQDGAYYGSPYSKIHGANMEPIWGRQDPGGPHVGPMNFAIWVSIATPVEHLQCLETLSTMTFPVCGIHFQNSTDVYCLSNKYNWMIFYKYLNGFTEIFFCIQCRFLINTYWYFDLNFECLHNV